MTCIASDTAAAAPLLCMRAISRDFDGVRALDDVHFDLREGEVHVLLGENGAGKSTLINIMTGALRPTRGQIQIRGQAVELRSASHARALGVSAVYQEFSLVGSMKVAENLFLGVECTRIGLLTKRAMRKRARAFLDQLGFEIDENAFVEDLTRGRQQMVEIAKALMTQPKVLIFDEPTASLTEAESDHLFSFIRQLREKGVGMVYISHRMKEIRNLADRVTIMRDGRHIATLDNEGATDKQMIGLMSGRAPSEIYSPKVIAPHAPRLIVSGLTLKDRALEDVSIEISRGEIVGVAGLVGCGKSALGRALFGIEPIAAGEVTLNGAPYRPAHPGDALKTGVCYFPSDRASEGLALDRSVIENASLSAIATPTFSHRGVIRRNVETTEIKSALSTLKLRPLQLHRSAASFSGGNKQKIVLARGFTRDISLFIFDEPTVGIDITAKAEIYATIARLAAAGASVLMISSELNEIIGVSHRVYVMNRGRIVHEVIGEDIVEEKILPRFFSH